MKRKSPIKNLKIQILLIAFMLTLVSVTAIKAQTISTKQNEDSATNSRQIPSVNDECSQMLNKTLDSLRELKIAKAAVDEELSTNKSLRAREEAYNAELLKAVSLLVSAEKRDKSFFKKLQERLEKILVAVTDPQALATIATLIILVKSK